MLKVMYVFLSEYFCEALNSSKDLTKLVHLHNGTLTSEE